MSGGATLVFVSSNNIMCSTTTSLQELSFRLISSDMKPSLTGLYSRLQPSLLAMRIVSTVTETER